MNPDELDAAIMELGERYDAVASQDLGSADQRMLQAFLSDWQDWYWGNLDAWPVTELAQWNTMYGQALDAVGRLETVVGDEPAPEPQPPQSGPIVALPELEVFGTWPLWMKVTAGSILALGLYKVARKLKWL